MESTRKDTAQEKFVDVRAAAEHLELAVSTVYTYTSQGKLPYYKLRGYGVRYLISELDQWHSGTLEGGLRGPVPAGARF